MALGGSGVDAAKRFGCTAAMVSKVIKDLGIKNSLQAMRNYEVDETFFDCIDSEPKAYFLGLLLTDGCVSRGDVILSLTESDVDIIEKFRTHIRSTHPITCISGGPRVIAGAACVAAPMVRLAIGSQKMVRSLARFGVIQRKTATVKPWTEDPLLARHFWRGCVDGDGSISRNSTNGSWQVQLCGTRELVEGFCGWSNAITGGDIHPRPIKKIWSAAACGRASPLLLAEALYGDATVALDRKHQRYLALKSDVTQQGLRPPRRASGTQRES